MNLELNEDQDLFAATTRRFLEATMPMIRVRALWDDPTGWDRGWWREGSALGWLAMFAPDELGGGTLSGRPTCDTSLVAEEIGRRAAPGPLLSSAVVVDALGTQPGVSDCADVGMALVQGTAVGAWAFGEPGGRWSCDEFGVRIEAATRGSVTVSGRKRYVEAAGVADHFLVSGRTGKGVSQVLVAADRPGVTILPGRSIDLTRRFGTVDFDRVQVPAACLVGGLGRAAAQVERQIEIGLALQCAEMNGAAEVVFHATVNYVKDRYAFGRPIGSFQALKHRLADMLQRLQFSMAIADRAAVAIDTADADAALTARVAKVYVADACLDIIDDCVQMHGGIGVTWEHDIHVFSRRVALDRALLGTPEDHKATVAAMLCGTGGR